MKEDTTVIIEQELLQVIFESARKLYPRETVFLLRGRKEKSLVRVTELVVPPLASYGRGFATTPFHMLPMDFSIVGAVHSHPSGNLTPSVGDLNRSFGRIIMIVGYPFTNEGDVAVYSRSGEKLILRTTKGEPSTQL